MNNPFESRGKKILKFLERKEKVSADEIADMLDIGKGKAKKELYLLMKKDSIERIGESEVYRLKQKEPEPENIPEPEPKSQKSEKYDDVILPPHPEKLKEIPEEKKKAGLADQVIEINEKLDMLAGIDKKRYKKLMKGKLKGQKKFEREMRKAWKKSKRGILYLKRDGTALPLTAPEKYGMVMVNDQFYDSSAMYTWMWKGKHPMLIVPEWSIKPICRDDLYQEAVKNKAIIDAQAITLKAIEAKETDAIKPKMKFSPMAIIGFIIAGIVVVWLIWGGK